MAFCANTCNSHLLFFTIFAVFCIYTMIRNSAKDIIQYYSFHDNAENAGLENVVLSTIGPHCIAHTTH